MAAFDVLREYLADRATFAPKDFAFIETVFLPRRLAAHDFLQRGGEVARYAAFISAGCLRSYVIDRRGTEHVVHFAPKGSWLADTASLGARTPSQYSYQAIEDSELLLIDPISHQMLVQRIPPYAASFATGFKTA